ncbi:MAG: hypothetical protein JWR51_4684 [Devosia sp.]|uniref:hypothetical protein n=1 Tax=Devosia sp. TaxID=1871048 RepID=UPI002618DA50|nr:hypothetical protein [Devosia sp.]MDB5531581.1 hypothetical protein [Devosia sp.]
MTDIPNDVMKAAQAVWVELASGLLPLKDMEEAEVGIIARAILAERVRTAGGLGYTYTRGYSLIRNPGAVPPNRLKTPEDG